MAKQRANCDYPLYHATPKTNREGFKNWQIVHSATELAEAKSAGKYTTKDSYIFDPTDLLDPKVKIGSNHFRKFHQFL